MSQLGKIFLYVAAAGAFAALIAGGLIIKRHSDDAAAVLKAQQDKAAADAQVKRAAAENAALTQAKNDDEQKLSETQNKVSDLSSQLEETQKKATDAASAADTANVAAKAAQDKLDTINKALNGQSVEDVVTTVKKAQDDLTAAQSEEKILQDQADQYKQQVADMQDALNRKEKGQMPGVSGKVTFVDHAWNFVILDVGLSAGEVPNGELIVYRGRTFLGKVRVTKVDPNDAVAEILPDVKGNIQIGDAVLN